VIENGQSVSIEYTLKLDDGTAVDTNVGEEPLTYTQGGSEILPALEEALADQAVGDTKEVKLTAEQGYGPIDTEAYQEVELDMVPEDAGLLAPCWLPPTPKASSNPSRSTRYGKRPSFWTSTTRWPERR